MAVPVGGVARMMPSPIAKVARINATTHIRGSNRGMNAMGEQTSGTPFVSRTATHYWELLPVDLVVNKLTRWQTRHS